MRGILVALLAYSRVNTRGRAFAPVKAEKSLAYALSSLRPIIQQKGARVTCDSLPRVMADEVQTEGVCGSSRKSVRARPFILAFP